MKNKRRPEIFTALLIEIIIAVLICGISILLFSFVEFAINKIYGQKRLFGAERVGYVNQHKVFLEKNHLPVIIPPIKMSLYSNLNPEAGENVVALEYKSMVQNISYEEGFITTKRKKKLGYYAKLELKNGDRTMFFYLTDDTREKLRIYEIEDQVEKQLKLTDLKRGDEIKMELKVNLTGTFFVEIKIVRI